MRTSVPVTSVVGGEGGVAWSVWGTAEFKKRKGAQQRRREKDTVRSSMEGERTDTGPDRALLLLPQPSV